MTPKDVVKLASDESVEFIDLKFIDLPGSWQHFSIPISQFDESFFETGLGFDGSSIRGWQPIEASDMIIRPDPTTAKFDPFFRRKTLSLLCNVFDPISGVPYSRDPRYIAMKAVDYLRQTEIGDTAYFGPEAEFFVFDDVRYEQTERSGFYAVNSAEGSWNTGSDERPNPNDSVLRSSANTMK